MKKISMAETARCLGGMVKENVLNNAAHCWIKRWKLNTTRKSSKDLYGKLLKAGFEEHNEGKQENGRWRTDYVNGSVTVISEEWESGADDHLRHQFLVVKTSEKGDIDTTTEF